MISKSRLSQGQALDASHLYETEHEVGNLSLAFRNIAAVARVSIQEIKQMLFQFLEPPTFDEFHGAGKLLATFFDEWIRIIFEQFTPLVLGMQNREYAAINPCLRF